ncbi:hypothetical protein KC571_02685 [candidate division WWE3 bacterium]|uniref:Uncharacterized protein n=1 Tax=candidate division WWE3 bacterium TaxID=2053526 RepID=A0A955LHF0_UNCKA|nr:hypothetical protein [candidate division WWE3 bacterium]
MKPKSVLKNLSRIIPFLLIILIFCFSIAFVYSQSLETKPDAVVIDENEASLRKAAEKKIAGMGLVPEGYTDFIVGKVRILDDWARVYFYSTDNHPPEKYDLIDSVTYSAIAYKQTSSSWTVVLETEEDFSKILNQAPVDLVSRDFKETFLTAFEANNTGEGSYLSETTDEYHVPGLPYPAGTGWTYNQGPHGCGTTLCALDFGTPNGTSTMVKAAEDGTITYVGDTCVKVKRDNSSFEILYQHIDPEDELDEDDKVDLGEDLGMSIGYTGSGPCSGLNGGGQRSYSNE